MASSVVMSSAVGTELQIPAVGIDRGGDIEITATHGFFTVNRTDGVTHGMTKSYMLGKAGATISGLDEATLTKDYLWYTKDNRQGMPFYMWSAVLNIADDNYYWRRCINGTGGYYSLTGSDNNDSKLSGLTNVYGHTFNGARVLADSGNNKYFLTDYMYRLIGSSVGGKSTDNFKFMTNVYIEEDTFTAGGYIISAFWTIMISRDGYQLWDGSNWGSKIAYKDNYVMPPQEWISIEIDFVNPNNSQSNGATKLYINGVDQEITPNNHTGNGSAIYLAGHTNEDTAKDYIRYSPMFMINHDLVERKLGATGKDEVLTTIRKLIKPV